MTKNKKITFKEKKAGFLKRVQLDALNSKPKTFFGKILVELRLRAMKKITLTSTYWNNDEALKKFVADNNVIILTIQKGDNPMRKLDYHLSGTEAQKQRLWKIYYVEENSYTTNILGYSKKAEHFRLGIL